MVNLRSIMKNEKDFMRPESFIDLDNLTSVF